MARVDQRAAAPAPPAMGRARRRPVAAAQCPRTMPPNPSRSSAALSQAEAPAAPRSGVGVVGRERLLARLQEARRLPCVVVTGPAGAGKSTLVAAWRQALVPLGFDVAWFTAAEADDSPARFF